MGLMNSWIAVQGVAKADLFAEMGWEETGQEVDPFSGIAAFSYLEKPGGWLVIFSDDFDWASQEEILAFSQFGLTLGCQFEDKVEMTSIVTAARDGVELWQVSHIADPIFRLDVRGEPPVELAAIHEQALRDQHAAGGRDAGVDLIFEVPLDLAKAICGYRADEEESMFMALDGADPYFEDDDEDEFDDDPGQDRERGPGLLQRFAAFFRRR